jgi:ABC-type multidrug transport system ATPase subunit
LDPAAGRQVMQIVRRLNSEYGYTFIIVTHDMELAAELATRILIMQNGNIIADGRPREILTNQDLLTSARLEPPTLTKVFGEMSAADRGAGTEVPITVAEARALLKRWKT